MICIPKFYNLDLVKLLYEYITLGLILTYFGVPSKPGPWYEVWWIYNSFLSTDGPATINVNIYLRTISRIDDVKMVRGCSALVQCIHTQVHKCTKIRFHNILSGGNLETIFKEKQSWGIRNYLLWTLCYSFGPLLSAVMLLMKRIFWFNAI